MSSHALSTRAVSAAWLSLMLALGCIFRGSTSQSSSTSSRAQMNPLSVCRRYWREGRGREEGRKGKGEGGEGGKGRGGEGGEGRGGGKEGRERGRGVVNNMLACSTSTGLNCHPAFSTGELLR